MSPEMIAALAVMSFLILIALEMPIALAITLAGLFGIVLLDGMETAANTLAATPYSSTAKYALFVIPMYVLLGSLISNAGIGTRIFRAVNRVVRRVPGGLAATTVVATSIFSGISGSSAADVATFGRISVTEMSRNGYPKAYAAAVVAAAGTFAVLIPPSISIVLYAIIAEESIGTMILAGVIPGAISALALTAFVIARGVLRPAAVPATEVVPVAVAAAGGVGQGDQVPGRPRRKPAMAKDGLAADLSAMLYAVVLFAIVVGGLYGGVFTATEAGAMGAFAALVIALISRKSSGIPTRTMLWRAMTETADVTSMIFLLLIGGAIFTFALALSGVPMAVSLWAAELPISPTLVVALMLFLLIPLGAFLDGLSILLLTVPIIAPVATELGHSGVWFGILVIKCIEIGLITPPVGVNAFIIAGVTDLPVERVFRALVPFVILDLFVTALFFVFPETVLWLPRVAGLL